MRFLVADLNARERLVVIAVAKQDTAVVTAEAQRSRTSFAELQRDGRRSCSAAGLGPGDCRQGAPASGRRCGRGRTQWAKTEQFAKAMQALEAAESTDAGRKHSEQAAALAGGFRRR